MSEFAREILSDFESAANNEMKTDQPRLLYLNSILYDISKFWGTDETEYEIKANRKTVYPDWLDPLV